jgi:hypothetical protein
MYPLPAPQQAGAADTSAEAPEPPSPSQCSVCSHKPAPAPAVLWSSLDTQSWLLVIALVLLGLLLLVLKLVWETKARLDLYLHLGWQKRAMVLDSGR